MHNNHRLDIQDINVEGISMPTSLYIYVFVHREGLSLDVFWSSTMILNLRFPSHTMARPHPMHRHIWPHFLDEGPTNALSAPVDWQKVTQKG